MRKTNETGIVSLGMAVIVIVVVVISGIGYFVYSGGKKTDKPLKQTNSTVANSDDTTFNKTSPTPVTSDPGDVQVQTITLSQAPADLRTAVLAHEQATAPACVKDGSYVDIDGKPEDITLKYAAAGYATTGTGHCDGGGAVELLAKTETGWQIVGVTQFQYRCSALKKYKVSSATLLALQGGTTEKTVQCQPDDDNALAVDYNY